MMHCPQRPTVPDAEPLVYRYLASPGNGAGGSLHVVLDDGNLEDCFVLGCLDWSLARKDVEGAALALVLLAMSPSQRHRAIHRARRRLVAEWRAGLRVQ